ncbi:Ion channel DMI1-like protein [Drosera capensis]
MSTPSLTATSGDGGESEKKPLLAGADSVRDSVAGGARSRSRRGGLGLKCENRWRIGGAMTSWGLYLVVCLTCVFVVVYALVLRRRIRELQGELDNHLKLSGGNVVSQSNKVEVLNSLDDCSPSDFSHKDTRTMALYTVILTLFMPFLLYKYLNHLCHLQKFLKRSKRTEKEEMPLKKRIAYRIDVYFSIYPYAKTLALLLATMYLIGFGGLALYAVSDISFSEAVWLSWTFVADSGNHADRVGAGPRMVSLLISFGGMLTFAMILGLVSDGISEKMDSLRKGKSEIIESNHILILGWSNKLGPLLKQLAIANKSLGGGIIVILAEREKEEMEIEIAKLEFDFMGTMVVSVSKARAIIVLAFDENPDQSDARALRVVLSLTGVKEALNGHVVVEISDLDNEPLVKLVGGDLIETVVAHDVIGRLMIQCALQPGLAQIWEDILGFENAEFYIRRLPQLDGMRFIDVLISFPDAVPCGVIDASKHGKIILNPSDDYVLKEGDEILVLAEDDDSYAPGSMPKVSAGVCPSRSNPPKFPEKVLEAWLPPGSELWLFNDVPVKERQKKLIDAGLDILGLVHIKLVHREGNAVIRRHLENLPVESFDSSKRIPDKQTNLVPPENQELCHSVWIRKMQQASHKSIIISEVLDCRTRNLVTVSRISDYVLSNELVSMALAMVAEDKQINRVLEELFAAEGNEMCIRPAEFYLHDQEELCFYEIMLRGRERREIVIGYRTLRSEKAYFVQSAVDGYNVCICFHSHSGRLGKAKRIHFPLSSWRPKPILRSKVSTASRRSRPATISHAQQSLISRNQLPEDHAQHPIPCSFGF